MVVMKCFQCPLNVIEQTSIEVIYMCNCYWKMNDCKKIASNQSHLEKYSLYMLEYFVVDARDVTLLSSFHIIILRLFVRGFFFLSHFYFWFIWVSCVQINGNKWNAYFFFLEKTRQHFSSVSMVVCLIPLLT